MEFITIPGFTRYRINQETKILQSKALGKEWRKRKAPRTATARVVIISDEGVPYWATIQRILYAAIHGINPAEMGREYSVVIENDSSFALYDRQMLTVKAGATRRAKRTPEVAKREYNEGLKFCKAVLRAYKTNDYSEVISLIWEKRAEIERHIRINEISRHPEVINDYWAQAAQITLDNIQGYKPCIINLSGYLRRVIRSLYSKRKQENRRFRSYDDSESTIARTI